MPIMRTALFVSAAALATPMTATAQTATQTQSTSDQSANNKDRKIQDIIVTAEKRETKLQDTPIAVSVVSGAEIQKDARTKLDDILVNTAGVEVQGVARGLMVTMRGLGLNLPAQNGAGAVATNYDGTYNSRGEAASTGFYDLERVETLLGPQSTVYGRNAVGGVVNVISRDPVLGKFGGYVQGEVGNYSDLRGEGAVNLPLGDTVALRVAAAGVRRDGYLSNGRDDNKASSLRAKLLWQPMNDASVLLGYEQTTLGGKGPGAIPLSDYNNGDRNTTDPSEGYQHHIARKYWAVVKADIGPGELFVQPSYQTLHGVIIGALGGNFAYDSDPPYTDQFAVEARYSSKAGAKVPWDVGYYHYYNKGAGPLDVSGACYAPGTGAGYGVVYVPAPGYSNEPSGPPGTACITTAYKTDFGLDARFTDVDSVFGQVVIPFTRALRLTLGGRESWVETGGSSDLNTNNTVGATTTPLTTPDVIALTKVNTSYFDFKTTLEANVAAHSLAYLTVASGHREGGYSFVTGPSATSAGVAPLPYAPEHMIDYEAGIKNTLLDGALLLNANVFYYDYKSYQLIYVNFSNFSFNFTDFPAREYGGMLEAGYNVTPRDHLTGSVTYLNSHLKCNALTCAYAGEQFTFAPRWTFKASYGHDFDLGANGKVTAHADFRALSSQLVTANATTVQITAAQMQAPYANGDLFLSWSSANRRYSLTGYVKNVNNKLIKTSDFFGYVELQAPRTYGATLNVKF